MAVSWPVLTVAAAVAVAELFGLDHAIPVAIHTLHSPYLGRREFFGAEPAVAVRIQPLQPALLALGGGAALAGAALRCELFRTDEAVAIGIELDGAQRCGRVDLGLTDPTIAVAIELTEAFGAAAFRLCLAGCAFTRAVGRPCRYAGTGETRADQQGEQ